MEWKHFSELDGRTDVWKTVVVKTHMRTHILAQWDGIRLFAEKDGKEVSPLIVKRVLVLPVIDETANVKTAKPKSKGFFDLDDTVADVADDLPF